MHRREDAESRGRFGLPPEQPARRALLSPPRAFILLAAAGLVAWLLVAVGSTDLSRDLASNRARAAGGVDESPWAASAAEVLPTDGAALEAFRALDRMRAGVAESESGAGGVLARGLSLRALENAVPSGGRTLDLMVLSIAHDQLRIRQVIELSEWAVDLTAEDLSIGRAGRRLGVEWTLAREQGEWRIAAWTVVEDRAVVSGR